MAGIDELHFEVLLDDKKFRQQIENDKKLAENLNISLSSMLDIRSKVTAVASAQKTVNTEMDKSRVIAEEVAAAERNIQRALEWEAQHTWSIEENRRKAAEAVKRDLDNKEKIKQFTQDTAKAEQDNTKAVEKTNAKLVSTRSLMSSIAQLTGVYFGAAGIRRFLSSMIEITGQFEVQKMALRTMLRDIDGADRLFEQLYQFSSDSTYRFSELAKHAKQLAGFGIGKDNLLETTKMLGDVASGLGVSMDRLILAYGHVKSSGFLRGIQLRSFSQNGVPILEKLAEILTEAEGKAVSLGEVFDKMTKREIPFEMVEEAFRRMTSEGGQFYQMQEVLSKTLAGQLNILKGRWENLMYAIGNSQDSLLKGIVSSISNLLVDYEKLGATIKEAVVVFGAYRAAVLIAAVANGTFTTSTLLMGNALKAVLGWLSANPWGVLAAGIALATAEIIKHKKELANVKTAHKDLGKAIKDYTSAQESEILELDTMYSRLARLTEGTKEYDDAKKALFKRFNPYIEKLREEGVAVNDLSTLYSSLSIEIQNANKERFLDEFMQTAAKTNAEKVASIHAQVKALIRDAKSAGFDLNLSEQNTLWDFVRGVESIGGGSRFDDTLSNLKGLFETMDKVNVTDSGMVLKDMAIKGKTFGEQFAELRKQYKESLDDFTSASKEAEKEFEKIKQDFEGPQKETAKWAENVEKALSGATGLSDKVRESLRPKGDEGYFKYVERLRKEYEDVKKLKDDVLSTDENVPLYDAELKAIRSINTALEGKVLRDIFKKESKEQESDENEKRNRIKGDIAILEKLRDAYKKLEPYLGGATAEALANIYGGDKSDMAIENIDESIRLLIKDLKSLGDEGKQAAETIEARLGMGVVDEIIDRGKALEKYEKMLRDWKSKDFNISGSGFLYDINKILTDYNTALAEVDNKYNDAVKQAEEAHKGNAAAIAAEIKKLAELRDAEKGYIKAQMQEKLGGLAKKIVEEAYQGNGIDLKNLGSASLGRLNDLLGKLRELRDTGGLIPEDMLDKINEAGFTVEGLMDSINNVINSDISRGLDVRMRRLQRSARSTVNILTEIGERMQTIGEITASGLVESLGEALQLAGKIGDIITSSEAVMNSMSEGMENIAQSNDWITMLVKIALLWIDTIITAVQSSAETAARAEDAIRDSIIAVRDAKAAAAETIIGESWTKRIRAEAENLRAAAEEYYKWLVFYEMYARSNPNHDVHSNWDNPDFLINYYDNLKGYYDEFTKRSEAFAKSIEEIFGDLASSIADQMVDAFVKTGDAMTDLSDSFNDLKKVIYKTFAQDILIDWFKNSGYISILTNLTSAYATGDLDEVDYATRLNKVLGEIQDILTSRVDLINQIGEALGLANVEAEKADSASLGKGIQSITEDTANLLASYINAMRADLSYIRLMQEGGWQDVRAIREAMSLGQAPNYNEYMAQIAANTFDTAQATNDILLELRSVIGSGAAPGSGVRVYIQ